MNVSSSATVAPQAASSAPCFLETVKRRAGLEDLYDARDVSEVVFRTMRDMMTTDAADRVASELQGKASSADEQIGRQDLAALWCDTNPLVRFLSRMRAPLEIKTETFLFRIGQEAGLSRGIYPADAVVAVFAALKSELSAERVQEIAAVLPDEIRQAWRQV